LDRNKNGKLEKAELSDNMAGLLERGDANKDGALDRGELEKVFERFRNRGARPGARPEGAGRGPRGGQDRPQRPGRDKKAQKEQPRKKKEQPRKKKVDA